MLTVKALTSPAVLLLVMARMIFTVAGTLRCWQGRVFLLAYFPASSAVRYRLLPQVW